MFHRRNVVFAVICALCGVALSLPLSVDQVNQRELALSSTKPVERQDSVSKIYSTPHAGPASTEHLLNAALERSRQRRVKHALTYAELNAPADEDYDMELAEINVFRPLFRYRAAYSKQVSNKRQQFG